MIKSEVFLHTSLRLALGYYPQGSVLGSSGTLRRQTQTWRGLIFQRRSVVCIGTGQIKQINKIEGTLCWEQVPREATFPVRPKVPLLPKPMFFLCQNRDLE